MLPLYLLTCVEGRVVENTEKRVTEDRETQRRAKWGQRDGERGRQGGDIGVCHKQ
jgi:hypothetical protein